MADYNKLPEHMQSGARLYIEQGILTGSFLTAVLQNNLVNAIGQADSINRQELLAWANWLMWDIPAIAWGSVEKVQAYIEGIREKEQKGATIH